MVIGSAAKLRTERNPLSFEERKELLEACFPDLEVVRLEDEDRGEKGYRDWTERFMENSGADIVVTRNDLVEELVEKYSDAEIVEQRLYRPGECSGTEIRERIRAGEDWKHLVPDCSRDKTIKYADIIAETGE